VATQLGEAHARGGSGDAHVAQQREREAPGDGGPVDVGDQRLGEARDRTEAAAAGGHQPLAVIAVAAELRDVHPGAESGARAGQQHAAHLVVAGQRAEGVRQRLAQLDRQRVALLRPVERHRGQRAVALDPQDRGHGGQLRR
jgi:hypothetical protein